MEKYTYEKNEEGEFEAVISPEWERAQKQGFLNIKYKEAGIAKDKWNFTFKSYKGKDPQKFIPRLEKYCNFFKDAHGIHLYLWSPLNSTQKSTLASVVSMNLIEQGYKVRFVLMSTLVTHLQNEQFKEESKIYIEDLYYADFLVIDDAFDPKKAVLWKSGYQLSFIDTFLRNRLEVEGLNTCFTSNIPIPDILEKYGKNIHALILRHCTLPMNFNEPIHDFNPNKFWEL